MIRHFLAVVGLLSSTALSAQVVPPDVQPYQPVAVTYAAGTTANVLGDGSTPSGGTPPALANLPAVVASPTNAFSLLTTSSAVNYTPCTAPTDSNGNACEMKFRTIDHFNHVNYDDPIRLYGQPGKSHCHDWAGNTTANAYSTYTSLRSHPNSTVGGYWLNSSAYWEPCVFNSATNTIVQPTDNFGGNPFYYTRDSRFWKTITELPRGLRFIGGTNMDDPDDTNAKAEIAAANAQAGTAGRYSYIFNGVVGWQCLDTSGNHITTTTGAQQAYSLVNSDGSDPWGGKCIAGYQMYMEGDAPSCWDGVNLWSPTGYKHVRYPIRDNTLSYPLNNVCPNHWYSIPDLEVKVFFAVGAGGFSDYKNWSFSSDAMAAMAAGHTVLPGGSFHFDWMYGWDDQAIQTWERFALGTAGGQPNTADYSTIDATHRMLSDSPSPDGKYPNIIVGAYPRGVRDVPQGSANVSGTVTTHQKGN